MVLKYYRDEIEKIDEQLIKLLEQRFLLSKKIGEIKKENNIAIENLKREQQLLDSTISKITHLEFKENYIKIFKEIFTESKKIQQ